MAVESTTKISGLNAAWPLGTDIKAEGDNHLRLIKSVLQACFDDSGTTLKTILPLDMANAVSASQRGFLWGCGTANNGTDATNGIDILPGSAATDDPVPPVMTLGATLTKKINAVWAVGNGNGGLDTGSVAASTWYHLYLIRRPDTGVVDALFSTSPTSPVMPASYTQKRRIASIWRNVGSIIGSYRQDGDQFMWGTPVVDVNVVNPGIAAVTRALTVPGGLRVKALLQVGFSGQIAADNPAAIYVSDLLMADVTPGAGTAVSFQAFVNTGVSQSGSGHAEAMTDVNRQVRTRLQQSATNTNFFTVTKGWVDTRGRL